MEEEGRARAMRAARSLGDRTVTEMILQHQNAQQLSANLWAAVRARGCQFLGPGTTFKKPENVFLYYLSTSNFFPSIFQVSVLFMRRSNYVDSTFVKITYFYFSHARRGSKTYTSGTGRWISFVEKSSCSVCRTTIGCTISTSIKNCNRSCCSVVIQGFMFQGWFLT